MVLWLRETQTIRPGIAMPSTPMSDAQAADIVACRFAQFRPKLASLLKRIALKNWTTNVFGQTLHLATRHIECRQPLNCASLLSTKTIGYSGI